jgi:hypothetical protein
MAVPYQSTSFLGISALTIFSVFFLNVASFPNTANEQALIVGRILDVETKQTIPCTVAIRTSDGALLVEHPSFKDGFRSTGQFEKAVPPGAVSITVSRGFDYIAVERKLNLREQERVELTLELKRRTPLRRQGWYTGDSHAHMAHGERKIAVDFPYVTLAARAEGLDYLALAQWWNLPQVTPELLAQACQQVSTPDFRLTWNMEAPKNYWRGDASQCMGHGWTLALRGRTAEGRDAIQELIELSAWDYESEKRPTPNFEIHALIHALGGIVSYSHPLRWWWGRWGGQGIYPLEERKFVSNMAQELPFDTVAGPTYDTLDILMQPHERVANEQAQQLWFMLLNHGYRIAATASSDTTFDNEGRGLPGKVRIYTRVTGEPTLERIAQAMRAGRNFVTSGPLLGFEIGAHQIGDSVRLDKPAQRKARIKAWASGAAGEYLTSVELLRNGEVVKTWPINDRSAEFSAEYELTVAPNTWYIVRSRGSNANQIALTNPIYFEASAYRQPQPTPAQVSAVITDEATGQTLQGVCEVIQMVGRAAVKQSQQAFKNGKLTLKAPATARLQMRVPGYAPLMKSIFADYAPLLEMTLKMRSEQLLDWQTFEETKRRLAAVQLEFRLAKLKQ